MKALIRDNAAVNVVTDEDLHTSFHPDTAALFEDVPDHVGVGWRLVDGVWVAPESQDSGSPSLPAEAFVIDVPTFKMRFTPQQLVEIRASQDATVRTFLSEIIDDVRTVNVNLALPFVQGAVAYLAQLGLIAEDDVAAVLAPKAG